MASKAIEAKSRAEALFNKKARQATEAAKARAEHETAVQAVEEKTARLRLLRLAKEAAEDKAQAGLPSAPKNVC